MAFAVNTVIWFSATVTLFGEIKIGPSSISLIVISKFCTEMFAKLSIALILIE